jgi:hypothetical protein
MAELRLEVRVEEDDDRTRSATLVMLVDGRDILEEAWGGLPRDPDDLLGDDPILLPRPEPHMVAGQICGCGILDCGSLRFRVRTEGDEVVWDQFHDGFSPAAGYEPMHDDEHVPDFVLSELRFDRAGYVEEVHRQASDRTWEWPERTAARLVREWCTENPDLIAGGWQAEWAAPWVSRWEGDYMVSGPGVTVSLRHPDGRAISLGFDGPVSDPERVRDRIVAVIEAGDETSWPIDFKGGQLSAWKE